MKERVANFVPRVTRISPKARWCGKKRGGGEKTVLSHPHRQALVRWRRLQCIPFLAIFGKINRSAKKFHIPPSENPRNRCGESTLFFSSSSFKSLCFWCSVENLLMRSWSSRVTATSVVDSSSRESFHRISTMAILFEGPLWERRKKAHHSSIHDCSGDERAEICSAS